MNPSPESIMAELSAERRLAADHPPEHPALHADWQLKQELGRLPQSALPPALRARVLAQTSRKAGHRLPPHWLGLAAALALALGLVWLQQTDSLEVDSGQRQAAISATDLEQLQLALAALDGSARLTGRIAGRELGAQLLTPVIQLDELPFAPQLRHWLQPPRRSESDS